MSKKVVAVALALTLVAAASADACAATPRDREGQVADRMLSALVRANGVPGMGAAVVVDGEVRWRGSAGLRDVERALPVDRHTVFRLASVSKLLTATAAAKLAEAGRLDLDAPVQPALPWLEATWAPVTPRQLAGHTSGMPHYQDVDATRGRSHYPTVRDAVGIFAGRPLLSPPGSAYRYSSWGYTLLSAAVEAAAGEPFLDYLRHDVAPGLAIGPDASDGDESAASRAYGFENGRAVRLPAHDFSYTWGGGGLAATPEAIALFGSRVMSGQVVSAATFRAMLQPTRLVDGSAAAERDYRVGLGWRVGLDVDGEPIAHHAGVAEGARSALVLWPARSVSASLLSNAQWVASIEQTVEMLAAPFRVGDAPAQAACPVGTVAYTAEFDGARFEGGATFSQRHGHCEGRIVLPDSALRTWLNGYPQRDADALEIVGLHPGAGIDRAALVTPIGLHDLRARVSEPGAFEVRFGPTRTLVIRLR